jgi:hypothetical protein
MGPISKKLAARLVVLGLATSVSALGIALSASKVALAAGRGGGGGGGGGGHGGGGGGGGHGPSGGGGHAWGGGGAGVGHASVSHFSAARVSGGHGWSHTSSHASHWSGGRHYSSHYSGRTHTSGTRAHTNLSKSNLSKSNLSKTNLSKSNLSKTNLVHDSHVAPLKHASDPKNFGNRRDFANKTAFNSFWHQGWHQDWWHRNHFFHIGWIGPLFWPYAYGDFFYFALWPWDYWWYDPFWAYGYGDIYQAVFFPYVYDDYVQGPRAPERMARLKQGITQSCNEEAGEVTGWPIDQIQAAVEPDQRQGQMLDDLGNAIVKASDEIRAHCQTNIAFTPTGRLDQMHQRLGALVDSVNTVSPPLSSFYDSLSNEQKARLRSHRAACAAARPGRAG